MTMAMPHSLRRSAWLSALLALVALACPAGADDIRFDTNNLLILVNDTDAGGTFRGTPYVAAVVEGMARFFFLGDLNIQSDDVVSGSPERPISLYVGNNATIAAGAVFNISASGTTPGPGGGSGGGGGPG